MGLRFRRSVKLAPGLRLNFSGSGMSLSAGPRGASVSFGSRGTFLNTGIPGTGLYSRSRFRAAPPRTLLQGPPAEATVAARVRVDDDGTVAYLDDNGQPLGEHLTNLAKRQQGDKIRALLADVCAKINADTEALGNLHCHTPSPNDDATHTRLRFEREEPPLPTFAMVSLGARLLGKRVRINAENDERRQRHDAEVARWNAERASFEAQQDEEARKFDACLRADVEFMQDILESNLASVVWPRETLVSFEINRSGDAVAIDVDLPEIEDMQRKTASLPERGYKLSLKEVKGKPLQELYSRHVHSVGFRIVGEVFSTLPTVKAVAISGYTQRTLLSTGHIEDAYIYSARILRSGWDKINFGNLAALDT